MSKENDESAPDTGGQTTRQDAAPAVEEVEEVSPLVVIKLKNLDLVGACHRVLDVHRAMFRFLTDQKIMFVHDVNRFGEFSHVAEKITLDVLDNVHSEYVPDMIHIAEDGYAVSEADLKTFQAKLRTPAVLQQVLKLIRLDTRIQVKSSAFDANPYEINVSNGLLNLETLELAPHNPSQLVTKLAPVSWVPDAPCSFWEGFIDDVTCYDKELAAYLQRLCGYCLSGSTQEEVMPILYGNGANGKSRFLAALRDILGPGEYALTLGTGSILNSKYHGIRCDLRQLEGVRVAFAIEANEESVLDEAVVKTIVAADEISARALRQNPVQFVPQAKIIMAVNHLPALSSTDHATRRRIQVVPFRKQFDGSVGKEEIDAKIQAERDGIFAWMVRGYQEWRKQGLNPPDVVRKVTDEYFEQCDNISTYLKEKIEKNNNCSVPVKALYEDYRNWAKLNCENIVKKQAFNRNIETRGFIKKPSNGKVRWYGLALKA